MGTRDYNDYQAPSGDSYRNGSIVAARVDKYLANAVISTYAETRRNVIAYTANTSGIVILPSIDTDTWHEQVNIPIGDRIVQGTSLRVYMRYQLSSALVANTARWQVELTGIGASTINGLVSTAVVYAASQTITIPGDAVIGDNTRLIIRMRTDAVNTMTIHSINAWQTGVHGDTWTDIEDALCKIGDDDWSYNALAMKILREDALSVRSNRTVKSNVYCHWYRKYHKNGAYGASDNDLGSYLFVKRAGIDTVWVNFLVQTDDVANATTVKITVGDSVEGTATQAVTGTAGAPFWYSKAFTFAGVMLTRDSTVELSIDADDAAFTIETYIPGICVTERPLAAAAVAHTVPDKLNMGSGSDIHASELDNMRTTCDHLYRRGGAAIAMADYRFGSPDVSYDERLCLDKSGIDKTHYGYTANTVACRALAYPSTSSVRWRVRMGYESSTGSTYKKYIMFQASDSLTALTYDSAGPQTSTNKWIEFTDALTGEKVVQFDLDITAGDWETPSAVLGPADVPMQLWVFGWSGNAAEYVKPKWITISEVTLESGSDDWP